MKQKTQPVAEMPAPHASALGRLRAAVHKRIKAVVALPVAAALLTATIVSFLPNRYVASAILQIDPRHSLALSEAETGARITGGDPIDSEIAVLRSEPVIARAAEALHLENDPQIKPSLPARVLTILKPGSDDKTMATAAIYSGLTVSRLRNTLLVNIRFSSPDPKKSARVANAVAEAYLAHEANRLTEIELQEQTEDGSTKTPAAGETASERMFASLMTKYGAPLAGARMVAKAQPPLEPSSLNRVKTTALAFGGGLLIAILIALALELRASPAGQRRRAKGVFACSHVTTIPQFAENAATATPSRACRVVLSEPQGSYADAVRETCRVLDDRRSSSSGRLLLCVSAVHGEGAELFASNIAHELAMANRSPLLVDTDLRGRGLTRQLAGRIERGMFEQIAAGQNVENAILRDATTGLHFLPAAGQGPSGLRPEDVLKSRHMSEALKGLRGGFETVILSATPLMEAADARALADIADDIIFVTAWDRTPEHVAQQALQLFEQNRRKVVAAVLTDVAAGHATRVMSFADIFGEIRGAAAFPTFRSRAA
ncbi:CpsD/CapB family tyrosine-protein kinase [Hyphomicrobium methylovorum]|uniref:CpsD/CapB family tyrosine-protein kinase n=1 Tax=Hyphomicrobium methylovorum TaxID=84 RepID=UPI0015E65089|nr:tyrosine-protein kinase domain-containing protein [Hyphomicrobium methylovorum]